MHDVTRNVYTFGYCKSVKIVDIDRHAREMFRTYKPITAIDFKGDEKVISRYRK